MECHGWPSGIRDGSLTRYWRHSPLSTVQIIQTHIKPSEPATFVQRLPNVFQTPWMFEKHWVVVVQTSLVHTIVIHSEMENYGWPSDTRNENLVRTVDKGRIDLWSILSSIVQIHSANYPDSPQMVHNIVIYSEMENYRWPYNTRKEDIVRTVDEGRMDPRSILLSSTVRIHSADYPDSPQMLHTMVIHNKMEYHGWPSVQVNAVNQRYHSTNGVLVGGYTYMNIIPDVCFVGDKVVNLRFEHRCKVKVIEHESSACKERLYTSFSEWIFDSTGGRTMLYFTYSTIPCVDLARYGVSQG